MKANIYFRYVILLIGLFINSSIFSQTLEWDWALIIENEDHLGAGEALVAVDANDNIFLAGQFSTEKLTIGDVSVTNPNPGAMAVAIFKFNSQGQPITGISYGATTFTGVLIHSITTDFIGNLYITGYANGAVNTNEIELNQGLYIMKIEPNMDVLWAKNVSSTINNAHGRGIQYYNEIIYIAGDFTDPSFEIGDSTFVNNNNTYSADIFLARFDSDDGSFMGAQHFGGNSSEILQALLIDNDANLYIAGTYFSPSWVIGNTTLTNSDDRFNTYIAKFDTAFEPVWAKSLGEVPFEVTSLAYDSQGNLYTLANTTEKEIIFNSQTYYNYNTDTGSLDYYDDAFVLKHSSDGDEMNLYQFGGTEHDRGSSIVIDDEDNIYIGITFTSDVLNGFNNPINLGDEAEDFVIAKLNSSGEEQWVNHVGNGGTEYINSYSIIGSIALTSEKEIVAGGEFGGTIAFDEMYFENILGSALFLAKTKNDEDAPSGLEMENLSGDFTIYPNPAEQFVNIYFIVDQPSSVLIEMIDMLGQKVQSRNIHALSGRNIVDMNTSNIKSGIYLIRVIANGSQQVKRVVIQ